MKNESVLVPAYLPKSLIIKKIFREGLVMAAFSLFVGYAVVWNSFQQSPSKNISSFNYQHKPQQFPVSPDVVTTGVDLTLKNLNNTELSVFMDNYNLDMSKQMVVELELENTTGKPLAAIFTRFNLVGCKLDTAYIADQNFRSLDIDKSNNSLTYFTNGGGGGAKKLFYLVFDITTNNTCKIKVDKEDTLVSVVGSDENALLNINNNLINSE